MGIFKRGNVYWCKKVLKGRKVEESLNTRNRKLADRKFADILLKIEDGSYFEEPVTVPRIREVIDKYMSDVSPCQKSHQRNEEIAFHWYDYLKDCLVSDLTKSKLATYKASRLNGKIIFGRGKGRKASASTVKKELSFLRQVLNKAMDVWDDDWGGYFKDYESNPVKKVIKGLKDVERKRYVMPAEARKLAVSLAKSKMRRLKDMVVIGCDTGLRESKIVNLTIHHCDFDNERINIPGEEMKNGDPFTCKMTAEVRSTLLRVLAEKGYDSSYIFVDETGQPYKREAVSKAFHRACERGVLKI